MMSTDTPTNHEMKTGRIPVCLLVLIKRRDVGAPWFSSRSGKRLFEPSIDAAIVTRNHKELSFNSILILGGFGI